MAGAAFYPRLEAINPARDLPLATRALTELWQSKYLDYSYPPAEAAIERGLAAALVIQKYAGGIIVGYNVLQKSGNFRAAYVNEIAGQEPTEHVAGSAGDYDWQRMDDAEVLAPLSTVAAKLCFSAVEGLVSGRVQEQRSQLERQAASQTAA